MKRTILGLAATLSLAACNAGAEEQAAAPECDYDCTLDRHLTAIQEHDWDAFDATLTTNEELDLILPNGALFAGRASYVETLQPWLTAGGFSFEHETVRQQIGSDMGYTLLRMRHNNETEDRISNFYLLLVFGLQDGEWRLIHDQNTDISDEVLAATADAS